MLKSKQLIFFLMILTLVTGCSHPDASVADNQSPSAVPENTSTPGLGNGLPTASVQITQVPKVKDMAAAYLDAWKVEQYQTMFEMLSPLSKDAYPETNFVKYYNDAATSLSLVSLDYEITSTLTNPDNAQVGYHITFHTNLFGDLERETLMDFTLVDGQWKVAWNEGTILPELKGGNKLALDVTIPTRGDILDINGNPIAAETDSVALGYIPNQVNNGNLLVGVLKQLLDRSGTEISKQLENAYYTPAQYVPMGEITLQDEQKYYQQLIDAGVIMENYKSRFYFDGGIASQVVGYTLFISEEQKPTYLRMGYNGSEKVGSAGLEKWGEQYLIGQRGAKLYVVDANGQPVTLLGQVDAKAAASIYTTFDKDFQLQVERSLRGFKGSVVVLQRDTGRILAMASSPTYDPNLFDPANNNSQFQLNDLLNDQDNPMLNRAAQSSYPPGSVFKIVTLAAALESGLYDPKTFTYDCTDDFTELPGVTLYNWTHWKELAAPGKLTLAEGLMRSCDPLFYHLGLDMYRNHMPKAVSDMSRAFGLGSPTGNGQIAEDPGAVPDPESDGDSVQLAFGQGKNLVTPLQMANYIAAVGNGGTLYRTQIVEKIARTDGELLETFKPEVISKLPLKEENLKYIQDAMHTVITDRNGTAHKQFLGMNINIHGKTGTATNSEDIEHAWFAGYTDQGDGNDIAIVVMCEMAGEGSSIAAPIFRRVLEYRYYGHALQMYPWETSLFITKTPTPLPPDTATPGPSPTPNPG